MEIRCRTDILTAYTYFFPASVDVIARIEHMEQIPQLATYCSQLLEDGLLETLVSSSGVVEYQLTETGRMIVPDKTLSVSPTKYAIFHQLRTKEQTKALLASQLEQHLRTTGGYYSLLQLQSHVGVPIPELSSILFGLLYAEKITSCGPLFGAPEESTTHNQEEKHEC
jgi:hypothetical protein